ncbi:MAG: MBL fold metallo-hydrolase [Okeania sp. SIO2F4]|uniref:MBL fold metallo-hydrolase n=1 Tax=Okeania sp. SIO2F4 TaxID=2607790 RepID=UPI001429054C|nr:MBL fold metallo-hydrolase [Okeania sp. SIO2F4]NES08026.1 MBL fold metallo-hydrolase [Okeania sp. SIO2F4]
MLFRQLIDPITSTYTYLFADRANKTTVLIDPVFEQVERDLQLLTELGLQLRYCLETHIHADHITGTGKLRTATGCLSVVPKNSQVTCADRFLEDGEILEVGEIQIQAIATPGHTDCHLAYLVNNKYLLTGDSLLIRGCGRTDFQGGDAGVLYDVVTKKLFTLPDETLVYPGHDYKGQTVSTIGEEKQFNPRFVGRDRLNFIQFMATLNWPHPKKMAEVVPANQNCGKITDNLD